MLIHNLPLYLELIISLTRAVSLWSPPVFAFLVLELLEVQTAMPGFYVGPGVPTSVLVLVGQTLQTLNSLNHLISHCG